MNLSNTDLSGTIPSQISTLINLRQLHCSILISVAPFLHRSQRSSICRYWICTVLHSVHHSFTDLNAHQFADIVFVQSLSGTIPPQISMLINLQQLGLSSTDLSGTIPSQISMLINLQQLGLSILHSVAPFLHRSQGSPICSNCICTILNSVYHSSTDLKAHQFAAFGIGQYST